MELGLGRPRSHGGPTLKASEKVTSTLTMSAMGTGVAYLRDQQSILDRRGKDKTRRTTTTTATTPSQQQHQQQQQQSRKDVKEGEKEGE